MSHTNSHKVSATARGCTLVNHNAIKGTVHNAIRNTLNFQGLLVESCN